MKRKNLFEIIGVLSLSFMLTCAMAISGAIPAMIEAFPGYSRSSVEFLLSVTSFMMMLMVALSPIISRYIPERLIVITGLVIYTISGITPVFIQSYPVMFISRILLGLGTGLINTKAISMIGERFTGELQQKLQGIRCSMETLGQTILTLVAGQLLVFGWNYSFLIYGASLIILILFVAFVPERKVDTSITHSSEITEKDSLTFADMPFLIGNALLGFLMVSTNVSLSLRISSYVIEVGIGTAADGATIMGISTFAGFIAGIAFGFMSKKLGKISLTQYEEAYIEKWVIDFGYDLNIIEIALKRTTLKSNATFANNIDNILDAEGVVNMFNPIFEKIKETMTKKEKKYFDFCIFSKCSEEYFRDKICNGLSRNGLAPIKDSCIMKLALGLNVEVLK